MTRTQPMHSRATGFCSNGRILVPSWAMVMRSRKEVCRGRGGAGQTTGAGGSGPGPKANQLTLLHSAVPKTMMKTRQREMNLSSLISFHGVCSSSMTGTSRQVSQRLLRNEEGKRNGGHVTG